MTERQNYSSDVRVRLTVETRELLDEIASQADVSVSTVVRWAVRDYTAARAKAIKR